MDTQIDRQTDRQTPNTQTNGHTHRHTDRYNQKHYLPTYAGGNYNTRNNKVSHMFVIEWCCYYKQCRSLANLHVLVEVGCQVNKVEWVTSDGLC